MNAAEHPYAPFLTKVRKPAQYLGGEDGQIKKDWDAVRARMCLAFPDLYEIGMSHLGFRILYGIINEDPRFLAERAYAVWPDMEAELRAHGVPLLSLENAKPLRDFDVVGFSLQFELTYTNVLQMLELGGIPLRSSERDERHPIVLAGGPCATHPEALAPFVDAFLIGDGEVKAVEALELVAEAKAEGRSREAILRELAARGGFYVPSLYERAHDEETGFTVVVGPRADAPEAPFPVERHIVRNLRDFPFPAKGPVAASATVFDRVSVEVARGCTEGCRFCQAGMIYRPVRERRPEDIIETIVTAVDSGGYDEASLTSLSTADYSAITPLVRRVLERLEGKNVDLSVSSLRAYGLSEAVLDDMATQRAKGLTFAPEAGTQRMRDVVNKNVTEAQLMQTAERVFSRGWEKMKLYFMIGLPTEEDEDVRGIVETGARALEVAYRVQKKKRARVTVSVSTHVPKPHTPFQWCKMDSYDEILRKQAILRDEAKKHRVQLRTHASQGSWLEGIIARGDEKVANAVEAAYRAGARFDGWDEQLDLDVWRRALEDAGVDPERALDQLPLTARLPWDHIDVGLEEGFLAREYRKAVKNRLSPPCGKAKGMFVHHTSVQEAESDARKLVCYDCGIACDMTSMRSDRVRSLRVLGAEAPPLPRQATEEAPKNREGVVDRRPMLHADQGAPVRLRLGFRKLGRMAYHGHLDLVRLFPRLFRRLGLPLHYSEGFNPKPQMTFTPALPLGSSSLGEYLDLKLRERDLDPAILDRIVDALDEIAFEGIEFFGATLLGPNDRSIGKCVNEATVVAVLSNETLRAQGVSHDDLAAKIEAFREGAPLVVERDVSGIKKRVDIRKTLLDVELGAGEASVRRAGYVGDVLPVRLTVRVDSADGGARPYEIVDALFGLGLEPRFVRESLYFARDGERATPLELARLRELVREKTATPDAEVVA
ncbi:MAG: TIGR03960 family B12-binding radical SAM protein [Myxococcales bacterium]|nr:TIGR03960 family B12-binding radical SAM protein [Myxococcales bacterium]